MSDIPTIAPALTAEEWAVRIASDGWRGAIVDFGRCACGSRMLANLLDPSLLPQSRHQLAALALHGQPFGFTREDVVFLRRVAEDEYTATGARLLPHGERLLALAARIEALLPPETTPNG